MPNVAVPSISSIASAVADTVVGVQGGVVKRFPLNTLATSYTPSGTGGVSRTYKSKVEEIERSVIDFGADPTGVADSTTAFSNALASGAAVIRIPAGTYKCSSINVNRFVHLKGEGREKSIINITTTTNHGMIISGESALGSSNIIRLSDFRLNYTGTGMGVNCYGLLVQRKVWADGIHVKNFTGQGTSTHGIYFAPSNADPIAGTKGTIGNAVFFSMWQNCRSSDNSGDGCRVRMGANANTFVNCQFDKNNIGFHQIIDGTDDNAATGSTYSNVIISGQASYNTSYGYHVENGTNITIIGAYAELNQSSDNTSANGYANGTVDFYIGDNITAALVITGALYGATTAAKNSRVRWNAANTSYRIWEGGRKIYDP